MRKLIILPVFLLYAASLLLAVGVEIESFVARSDDSDITIEWRTSGENNVKRFEVERSVKNSRDFAYIGTVKAKGSGSNYRYVDEDAFLKGSGDIISGTIYFYRLKVIDISGEFAYTDTITVSHTVSSVRQTWGMIKALFR